MTRLLLFFLLNFYYNVLSTPSFPDPLDLLLGLNITLIIFCFIAR